MPQIGAIADDLTGATTVGVLLARSKVRTNVFFRAEAVDKWTEPEQIDAVIVSTDSRALPATCAYEKVQMAAQTLMKMGVRYYQKRIDTTMRGNIGIEIDAMLDVLPENTVAVVVPAMPWSRRILVGGYSIIDGVPLVHTSAARDVRTPVKENYIPCLLGGQTRRKVGLTALDAVLRGEAAVEASLRQQREAGCKVIVVDAVTEEDIVCISKACVSLGWEILTVDPGPFTAEMIRQRGLACPEEANIYSKSKESAEEGTQNTVLIVAGSATDVTKKQMEIFCRDSRHIRVSVSPRALIAGGGDAENEICRVTEEVLSLLEPEKPPRAVLIETALHGECLDLDSEDARYHYEPGKSADMINEGLGKAVKNILEKLEREKIAGLYLTGGDTMAHVCRSLGVRCLEVVDYVVPQTDVVRLEGGRYSGMPVVGKGGMTGYDNIVDDIVTRLFAEANS